MKKISIFLYFILFLISNTSGQNKTEKLLLGGSGWNKIVIIDKESKQIEWEHPLQEGWECNSVAATPDGNILFSYGKGAKTINRNHQEIWNITVPDGCEMQTARVLSDGNYLLAWTGHPAVIMEVSWGMASGIVRQAIIIILNIIIPVLIVAVIIAILGNMLQQRWMVTAKPLAPKASKINPLNGFKRIFSVRQLFELIKAVAMMSIIGIMVYNCVRKNMNILLTFYDVTLYTALSVVGNIIINLGIQISAVFLIVGFVDLIYQRHKFKTDNMMTKQEIKDEFKNAEGDPQVKGQIKRRMQEISRRRMMQQLPEADVVITNPTHFAVALKYEPDSGKAPVVIAKGADYLAFQIRDKAKEYNISVVENKPLARIIYHNVDIGMEIPPELYYAVAEILASVLRTNNR